MYIYVCMLCVSFETPSKIPILGHYAVCIPVQLVYSLVPAYDRPATADATDSGTSVPGSVPMGPSGSAGWKLVVRVEGGGTCRRISSHTVALTKSRNADITVDPMEAHTTGRGVHCFSQRGSESACRGHHWSWIIAIKHCEYLRKILCSCLPLCVLLGFLLYMRLILLGYVIQVLIH